MKNNNIIRLNENELFNLIKENVRKVLREYSYDTAEMQIEVGELDLPEELYELLEDNYEYVTVRVEYEIEPYCSGDWDTPPSGGCAEIHNYTIDPDGDFKNIITIFYFTSIFFILSKNIFRIITKNNKFIII